MADASLPRLELVPWPVLPPSVAAPSCAFPPEAEAEAEAGGGEGGAPGLGDPERAVMGSPSASAVLVLTS